MLIYARGAAPGILRKMKEEPESIVNRRLKSSLEAGAESDSQKYGHFSDYGVYQDLGQYP